MSTENLQPHAGGPATSGEAKSYSGKRRSLMGHLGRGAAWLVGGILALVMLAVGGVSWYTTTSDFQHRVGREIVSVLEDATGGRVELHGVRFSLWHLAVEADDLVIHGTEASGEAPYLSADKILVRLGISSFFSHASGVGVKSHVRLKLLRVEHPQVHLIIDKNGHTNQPVPKHPSTSSEPFQDTLLDLRAKEADVVNGVALVNDQAIPFDMTARNLDTEVFYLKASDRYGITLALNDLRTKMDQQPEAQSKLHLEAELGRDTVLLKSMEFDSGKASVLHATGTLTNFAHPDWSVGVKGKLELQQLAILANVDGLKAGTLDLDLNGHSCAVSPQVAQTHPHFWQHNLPIKPSNPGIVQLPPDPECKEGYLLAGSAKVRQASYEIDNLHLHGVDGGAQLHITPRELLLTAMTGYLPGGGSAAGELRITDWLGEAQASAPAKSPTVAGAVTTANKTAASVGAKPVTASTSNSPVYAHAYLVATVNAIPLRTIMEVTETRGYGDLGFDTAVTGPVNVQWGGPATDIADTVMVDGNLKFRATGVPRKGALNNVPVNGEAVAHYDGKREVVNIQHVILLTPKSSTEVTGVLGVNQGDPLTSLKADMTVRDLGEFDQLLQTLGFSANGKKGAAAVPVVLHGESSLPRNRDGACCRPGLERPLRGHATGS
jgi:translocation and assembly module TamB